ncbi:MAG: ferrochelatase [Chlorobium sp.]|uniref:ferrochelatase n=1 Tax=Chlorobium sp. TaxID=1095 RepID=UPI0025B9BF34|nr:ferrochelatase [Chlorobium sp.]MCF8216424.1 ferrochelatase [Chlorobium sp.]MCF8271327.1 ferrochelatase [Chlorobium sp.]MCF8287701.1 ferrochelatase [Chlorobium sp.]MCF8291240.1 ferrochelatase [Chlorobium sp.]MCF8385338.1 ferrochelatase [Chlorobium sp.]
MVDRVIGKKRYAVLIVTYGEVEKLTLRNLWPSSRRILKVITSQIVKVPMFLVYFIADYRSTKHFINWRLNGYRSSLLSINRAQTKAISRCLAESHEAIFDSVEADVFDAYYFVPPYLEDVLREKTPMYDGIVVVPMIPVESAFSCGVACRMIADQFGDSRYSTIRLLNKLWKDPELHRIYLDHLFAGIDASLTTEGAGKTGLVLVIHGTLVRDRAGNPPRVFTGLDETGLFFDMMKQRIVSDSRNCFADIRQGCMNHSAGGEWTSETVQKALAEFREEGIENVVMFPYGFFADNSETEYEARKELGRSGFAKVQYIRCINESTDFACWLADRITDELDTLSRIQHTFDYELAPSTRKEQNCE